MIMIILAMFPKPHLLNRPVYEEGVVQDVKLVIHQTELESLVHLVRPSFPGQSLIVPQIRFNLCCI